MNFTTQRFYPGHACYSEAIAQHDNQDFKATFGRFVDANGAYIDFTMERRDTLIPEGTYKYSLYPSRSNKAVVLLLHDVPGFEFIEHHVANYPYELRGCTAHGLKLDVNMPSIEQSRTAFDSVMKLVKDANPEAILSTIGADGKLIAGTMIGTITYETLKQEV